MRKTDHYNDKAKTFNAWIATTEPAKHPANFYVVDMDSPFVKPDGALKHVISPEGIYFADGVHPSHAGDVAIRDA